mgnify:FL=1
MKLISHTRHYMPKVNLQKTYNIMRLSVVLCMLSLFCASAKTGYSQVAEISLNLHNVTISEALEEIKQQSEYSFWYKNDEINLNEKISVKVAKQSIDQVLHGILVKQGLSYTIDDKHIIIYKGEAHSNMDQKEKKITGVITDQNKEPIIGANVLVKGTTNGTITDLDGKFTLQVPEQAVLEISYIGYITNEISVKDKIHLTVQLKEDAQNLDEVVVVGYGTMKKSDLTGSVSSLSTEDITRGFAMSPDMALRGKTAGVQIVTQSGQPGAGGVVRIRGNSSILGSNEPLYVVDGVPLSGGDSAEGVDGVSSSPLTTISPSDIESMEILKDASATAIYGSRGANGVVMITTKQGKEGRFVANLNITTGFQKIGHKLELTSPIEWAEMWNEAMDYLNNGVGKYDLNQLPAQTDWIDAGYRTALLQNYELSLRGGTQKLRYMLSGGYSDQEGIVIGTDFNRYTLRANLENDFNKWLSIGANISASRIETKSVSQGSLDGGNVMGCLTTASPIVPIFDEEGEYIEYIDVESKKPNPYASLKEITNMDVRNRFISNVYANITIIPELKFKTSFAIDAGDAKAKHYTPSYIAEGKTSKGIAKLGQKNSIYWNSTNTLTYIKTVNDHSLNAMLGAEWQKSQVENFYTQGSGFANDNSKYDNISEATVYSSKSGFTGWQMASYMTRINYSFKNRYSFTFTGRFDGSSRFGSDNRYAFFPSGAFAWRVTEEDFMKKQNILSNMKLRLSYGSSGEQGIDAYQTLSVLNPNLVYIGTDLQTGYFPTRAADPSLKWERTNQVNVGLDIGFLKNRLNLTLDYYYKRTNDLLYYKALPGSSGFVSMLRNMGSIDNQGIEIMLNASVIQTRYFEWNLSINNSINRNKLISLGDGREEIINPPGGVSGTDYKSNPSILQVGKPLGLFYGYISDGVIFDEEESKIAKGMGQLQYAPGELKIRDIDGDGKITTGDKTIIGDANPDFTGGMTNSFSYKGFQLDVACDWVVGNDIMSYQHLASQRITIGSNVIKDWYDKRWTPERPSRIEPRAGYDVRAYADVSYHVFNGSFFRINNITFSYTFPESILKRSKLANLKIFANLDNVYTFTKYPGWSPDVSIFKDNVMGQGIDHASYPIPRTVSFGINVGF